MIQNKHDYHSLSGEKSNGFTLIELTVVIFIAGLLLSLTVPTVRDNMLHDNLKTVSRKLAATMIFLRNKSVSEYSDHVLLFDFESGKYWYETESMNDSELEANRELAGAMPDDVRIADIERYGDEKHSEGQIGIIFSKKGYARYSLIHLTDDSDRKFTLVVEPFLSKTKIMEDFVGFEDLLSEDN